MMGSHPNKLEILFSQNEFNAPSYKTSLFSRTRCSRILCVYTQDHVAGWELWLVAASGQPRETVSRCIILS